MRGPLLREYHAPWPEKVESGRGLAVILIESETQRLVLLADTPWNRGASMTNAIGAVLREVVEDILAPRGLDWRGVDWIELDSSGHYDVPQTSGPPGYSVNWSPLVAVDYANVEHRRDERAFLAGFGADARTALDCFSSLAVARMRTG